MNISDTLRAATKAAMARGSTRYRISKGSGVNHTNLSRFLFEGRDVRVSTVDALAGYLGLELRPNKPEREAKSEGASLERLGPRHK